MQSQPAQIAHVILVNDSLFLELLDAEWYDKPTAALWCADKLKELHKLASTATITITSHGQTHIIDNQAEFCRWISEVFQPGYTHGFARMVCYVT